LTAAAGLPGLLDGHCDSPDEPPGTCGDLGAIDVPARKCDRRP
jgi:hypothetical protein